MAETRRLTLADGLILLAILVLAAGARAGYLMTSADGAPGLAPLLVETAPEDLETLATNLTDRGRFASRAPLAAGEEETAHVAPGYPWLMSAAARGFGTA